MAVVEVNYKIGTRPLSLKPAFVQTALFMTYLGWCWRLRLLRLVSDAIYQAVSRSRRERPPGAVGSRVVTSDEVAVRHQLEVVRKLPSS